MAPVAFNALHFARDESLSEDRELFQQIGESGAA
jgi:hypothetical protein